MCSWFVFVFSLCFVSSFFGDVGVSTGITTIFCSDGLLVTLAMVRQRELYLPAEARLPGPFNLSHLV
jgi:hypothetical protein